jgi:hypothetical protein
MADRAGVAVPLLLGGVAASLLAAAMVVYRFIGPERLAAFCRAAAPSTLCDAAAAVVRTVHGPSLGLVAAVLGLVVLVGGGVHLLRRRDRVSLPFPLIMGGAVAGVAVAALLLRYRFIEPENIGFFCRGADAPAWCDVRQAVILAVFSPAFGLVAMALGGLALLRGGRSLTLIAAAVATAGCLLYNVGLAAPGLLLASLRAFRL